MRRLLLILLLISGSAAVVEGIFPCDVVTASPDCYVALRPGPTRDVLELVEIAGGVASTSAGQLLLTTVSVETELTLGELWRLDDDPTSTRASKALYFPEDVDPDVTREQFAAMMSESEQTATVAALRQVGYDLTPDGVRVESVLEDGPSDGVITAGEVIVSLDGVPTLDTESLLAELAPLVPGDEARFEVEQDDGTTQVRVVTLGALPDDEAKAFAGLFIVSRIDLPVEVTIDAGSIGGPSAGMMFALTIVDLLTDEDLTGGLVVAGTGEIGLDGRVGPIGGIQQKIPGAMLRGDEPSAEVFLVPRGNVDEARGAAVLHDITLVPIDTLADAVAALTALRAGQTPADAFVLSPSTSAASG